MTWISLLLIGCTGTSLLPNSPPNQPTISLISPSGTSIRVQIELADTPEEHSQGLMLRESISPDSGMLFAFEEPQILIFWMKNTLIPLDILFFDASGTFVSSLTMVPCTKDPCPTYPSAAPAKYALEVPAGFLEAYGIGIGWKMKGF